MIGLDSYILNIFSHLEPIWIYISYCMTSLMKLEIAVWFSGFYCQFIQGNLRGLIIRNRSVWHTLFLLNVFTAFKGTHFVFLFVIPTLVLRAELWF